MGRNNYSMQSRIKTFADASTQTVVLVDVELQTSPLSENLVNPLRRLIKPVIVHANISLIQACYETPREKLKIQFRQSSAVRRNVDKFVVRHVLKLIDECSMQQLETSLCTKLDVNEFLIVQEFAAGLKTVEEDKSSDSRYNRLYSKIISLMLKSEVLRPILYQTIMRRSHEFEEERFGKIKRENISIYKQTLEDYISFFNAQSQPPKEVKVEEVLNESPLQTEGSCN